MSRRTAPAPDVETTAQIGWLRFSDPRLSSFKLRSGHHSFTPGGDFVEQTVGPGAAIYVKRLPDGVNVGDPVTISARRVLSW